MKRIALGVEYDGTRFCGWQRQAHGERTVQEELEKALSRVADHEIRLICAGRTDTGVHATGQVVHFDTEAERELKSWIFGANVNLAKDVNVSWAKNVERDFHARFSAQSRRYRYRIFNRLARSALHHKKATWIHHELDETLMQQAAHTLVGTHDFSSYRTVHCQAKSPVRTISELIVERKGHLVDIVITADGFLHHMVRNIAGVLISIGLGKRDLGWEKKVLDFKDRTKGDITAPADGLYLEAVEYPQKFAIPMI